jgi:hypothetical protein
MSTNVSVQIYSLVRWLNLVRYVRYLVLSVFDTEPHTAIALPMGMSGHKLLSLVPSMHDILTTLDNAEKLFWADLGLTAKRGKVSHVRDTVVSLALIRALQTSLGKAGKGGPVLAVNLLGWSSFIAQPVWESHAFLSPQMYLLQSLYVATCLKRFNISFQISRLSMTFNGPR